MPTPSNTPPTPPKDKVQYGFGLAAIAIIIRLRKVIPRDQMWTGSTGRTIPLREKVMQIVLQEFEALCPTLWKNFSRPEWVQWVMTSVLKAENRVRVKQTRRK